MNAQLANFHRFQALLDSRPSGINKVHETLSQLYDVFLRFKTLSLTDISRIMVNDFLHKNAKIIQPDFEHFCKEHSDMEMTELFVQLLTLAKSAVNKAPLAHKQRLPDTVNRCSLHPNGTHSNAECRN